ncbi:MAG: twin transmembrane helix small protein [Limnohabitans sp.]
MSVMKTLLVSLAFVAILGSLALALRHMMRGPGSSNPPRKGGMARALAFRVGFSILLFLCMLLAWTLGWVQPTGIPAGH